jgi:hypothetical protein
MTLQPDRHQKQPPKGSRQPMQRSSSTKQTNSRVLAAAQQVVSGDEDPGDVTPPASIKAGMNQGFDVSAL